MECCHLGCQYLLQSQVQKGTHAPSLEGGLLESSASTGWSRNFLAYSLYLPSLTWQRRVRGPSRVQDNEAHPSRVQDNEAHPILSFGLCYHFPSQVWGLCLRELVTQEAGNFHWFFKNFYMLYFISTEYDLSFTLCLYVSHECSQTKKHSFVWGSPRSLVPYRFTWTRNGKSFNLSSDPRIILSNGSGTFRIPNEGHVTHFQGRYRCFASNTLGVAMSEEIQFIVPSKSSLEGSLSSKVQSQTMKIWI